MKGGSHEEVTIYAGDVHASQEPTVIKTLLGSCIAVCLFDPVTHIGGMNHFMLPQSFNDGGRTASFRFGVPAMDYLIGMMLTLGATRDRFVAKVFGGGHVLKSAGSVPGVPERNIDFIRKFLADEGIPVLTEDVGGHHARHVRFQTHTGRAFVSRVESRDDDDAVLVTRGIRS
ncbi:MAG: chemotaxis protein CheD [Candidatus Methylomirabilales bacterium]